MNEALKYIIALSQVKDVGPISARLLLKTFGNAQNVFRASKSELLKINGLGITRVNAVKNFNDWHRIETELEFIEKNKIECLNIDEESYPKLLKNCVDAPIILYSKGEANLNNPKIISVIGRRMCTDYGRRILDTFIKDLASYNVLIVSGLAIGIDIYAHKQALANNIATVGVLAHGLDMIYPSQHKSIAKEMIYNGGGLITEYISGTNPDRENFPTRNRIVAGISQATVVVETDVKGGSMITANLANGYNKDVMAFPGNINNVHSSGCNQLIKTHKANLITDAKDLIELLNWETKTITKKPQRELFIELSDNEKTIIKLLETHGNLHTDALCNMSGLTLSKFAGVILNLELQNIVNLLPAKVYKLAD